MSHEQTQSPQAVSSTLGTLWEVPDELWVRVEPILQADWQPSAKGGRPVGNWRAYLNGIIYRMRSGCQWNHLPKEFGDDATIHRWFQRWCRHGVMERIWAELVKECEELHAIDWEWQSADGWLGKARFGGKKGWSQSDRSRQTGYQEESAGRGRGRSAGIDHRRG